MQTKHRRAAVASARTILQVKTESSAITKTVRVKNRSRKEKMKAVHFLYRNHGSSDPNGKYLIATELGGRQQVARDLSAFGLIIVEFRFEWLYGNYPYGSNPVRATPGYCFESIRAVLEPNGSVASFSYLQKRISGSSQGQATCVDFFQPDLTVSHLSGDNYELVSATPTHNAYFRAGTPPTGFGVPPGFRVPSIAMPVLLFLDYMNPKRERRSGNEVTTVSPVVNHSTTLRRNPLHTQVVAFVIFKDAVLGAGHAAF